MLGCETCGRDNPSLTCRECARANVYAVAVAVDCPHDHYLGSATINLLGEVVAPSDCGGGCMAPGDVLRRNSIGNYAFEA